MSKSGDYSLAKPSEGSEVGRDLKTAPTAPEGSNRPLLVSASVLRAGILDVIDKGDRTSGSYWAFFFNESEQATQTRLRFVDAVVGRITQLQQSASATSDVEQPHEQAHRRSCARFEGLACSCGRQIQQITAVKPLRVNAASGTREGAGSTEGEIEVGWSKDYNLKDGTWFWLRDSASATPRLLQILGGRSWLEAFGLACNTTEFLGPITSEQAEQFDALRSQLNAAADVEMLMRDEIAALRKAAENVLPFVESVAAHCHHSCQPEECSAEGQRRAKQGRIIASALRRALGKQQ